MKIPRWLPDAVAIFIAWSFCLWSFGGIDEGRMELVLLIISLGNCLWLQIRLAPLALKLTDTTRRETMALTPMPAGEYLASVLKQPFSRAIVPAATVFPFLAVAVISNAYYEQVFNTYARAIKIPVMAVALVIVLLLLTVAAHLFAATGIFDMLLRACRKRPGSGFVRFFAPLFWGALALGAPLACIVLFIRWIASSSMNYNGPAFVSGGVVYSSTLKANSWGVLLVVVLLAIGLLALSVFMSKSRWRQACQAYYELDPDSKERYPVITRPVIGMLLDFAVIAIIGIFAYGAYKYLQLHPAPPPPETLTQNIVTNLNLYEKVMSKYILGLGFAFNFLVFGGLVAASVIWMHTRLAPQMPRIALAVRDEWRTASNPAPGRLLWREVRWTLARTLLPAYLLYPIALAKTFGAGGMFQLWLLGDLALALAACLIAFAGMLNLLVSLRKPGPQGPLARYLIPRTWTLAAAAIIWFVRDLCSNIGFFRLPMTSNARWVLMWSLSSGFLLVATTLVINRWRKACRPEPAAVDEA